MRDRVGRILLVVALAVLAIGLEQQVGQAQSGGATFTFYDLSSEQEEAIRAEWATAVEWMTSEYELPEPRTQFAIGQTLDSVRHLIPENLQSNFCAQFTGGQMVIIHSCEHRGSLVGWYAVLQGIGGSGDHFVEEHHVHRGPLWLSVALGEYLDSKFAAAQGTSLVAERARRQFNSSLNWGILREFEDRDTYWSAGLPGRDLAWLAVDWLVEQSDEDSYIRYFTRRGEHRTWGEALEAWFGLKPAQFYAQFAQARPEIERIVTGATVAQANAEDREGIWLSTPLYPGLNLIGWLEAPTPAADLFAAIPRAEIAYTWNGVSRTWSAAWRGGSSLGGLTTLRPGMGIWLRISEGAPMRWERKVTLASPPITNLTGTAELGAGVNQVAWAGWSSSLDVLGDDLVRVWQWDAPRQDWLEAASRDASELNRVARTPHGQAIAIEVSRPGLWRQSQAHWWPERTGTSDWIESTQFWGEVSDDDRRRVHDRLDAVASYFSELFGSTAEPEVHVASDEAAGAEMFAALYGPNAVAYCGSAGRGEMLIIIDCQGRDNVDFGVIAHEFLHILQSERYLARFNTDGFVYVKSGGPGWIVEGWAEWARIKYLDSISPGAYAEARRNRVWAAGQSSESLYDARLYLQSGMHNLLGVLAGERLAARHGPTALLEYFSQLEIHGTPEAAFEATFDISLDDFYQDFAEWRAAGFPIEENQN